MYVILKYCIGPLLIRPVSQAKVESLEPRFWLCIIHPCHFYTQTLEKTNYPELEAAILQQTDEASLVYHPPGS